MMKKILLLLLFINFNNIALGSNKENIINKLINTTNLSFNFEQSINGETETGYCIIEYPKKIFCQYDKLNKKILVSNGKSLVIKTKNGSYYRYAIKRTPLNYILDKEFLIKNIKNLNERIIDNKFINYNFSENNFEINIFFDYSSYNLIGWQTEDIYQNLSITFISSIKINQKLDNNKFKLPKNN